MRSETKSAPASGDNGGTEKKKKKAPTQGSVRRLRPPTIHRGVGGSAREDERKKSGKTRDVLLVIGLIGYYVTCFLGGLVLSVDVALMVGCIMVAIGAFLSIGAVIYIALKSIKEQKEEKIDGLCCDESGEAELNEFIVDFNQHLGGCRMCRDLLKTSKHFNADAQKQALLQVYDHFAEEKKTPGLTRGKKEEK